MEDILLDPKKTKAVFINYGSVTTTTHQHLKEFAWGVANSKHPFLWIVRDDVVQGDCNTLPNEFFEEAGPSVGGVFNTGCNSTLETISEGVPVIYWPFFAVQKTNCRYTCTAWEMGVEVSPDVKRDEVEGPVKKILDGEEGMKMRAKAKEWKSVETTDIQGEGSSYNNFKRLIEALQCGK
ncbi:hypothetical protein ACFX1X_019350 [Malus domestica]